MVLFHTSPLRNFSSIVRHGLLVSKARTKLKAVWLHHESRAAWASAHVCKRHRTRGVVCIGVRVPDAEVVPRGEGIFICQRNIRPRSLFVFVPAPEAASSTAARRPRPQIQLAK